MRPRLTAVLPPTQPRIPHKQLAKQPLQSPTIPRIPSSNQTSDEESETSDEPSIGYTSSCELDTSEQPEQPLASSSESKSASKYILINGKLQLKSKSTKQYACTHEGCGNVYRKPSRLEEHERSHTGERPFICPNCQKSYLRESHLRAHSRSHMPASDRPFVCAYRVDMTKNYAAQDLIPTQRSLDNHPVPSTSATENCNQRFWTAQHLRAHELAIHLGEKPYKCLLCPAAFAKHGTLRLHSVEYHAPPGTKPYRCEHSGCDQSFQTNQKLKMHSRVHDITRYACAHRDCSKTGSRRSVQFSTWTALQAHMHSDHPPKCPYESCQGRTFASSKGLRGHIKTHEDREKEEDAHDVQTPSTNTVDLKRAHAEEYDPDGAQPPIKRRRGGEIGRDWPCSYHDCDKTFKSKKAKQDHIRVTHEGSRNFPCPKEDCTLAFGYKHVMQRHLERHHREAAPGTSITIQTQTPTAIELLTGQQRSAVNRPRIIVCPWPDAFGDGDEQVVIRCPFKFSRGYDLRRHLKSTHGLEVEPDEVNAWLLARKR